MPLLLQPARTRTVEQRAGYRHLAARVRRGRGARHSAGAFLRRRAHGTQGSASIDAAGRRAGSLQQPHHLRRAARPASARHAGKRRPRSSAAQFPGCRDRQRRTHRRAARRPGTQARDGPAGQRNGYAADPQFRGAPSESGQSAGDDRTRARTRRRADRDRPCAVLRLGTGQSGCAAAESRAARCRDRDSRGGQNPAQRAAGDRLCRARLLCRAAESLHGRLGPALYEHHAGRARIALSRRRELAGLRLSVGARVLAEIWNSSDAFQRYRGTGWMAEPCRSCDRREIDWGGCRCQAFALTGDAGRTDPACALSPDHGIMAEAVAARGALPSEFVYRRIGGVPSDAV